MSHRDALPNELRAPKSGQAELIVHKINNNRNIKFMIASLKIKFKFVNKLAISALSYISRHQN